MNDDDQNSSLLRRSSKQNDSQIRFQFQNQQRCLQNYLNQSFKVSEQAAPEESKSNSHKVRSHTHSNENRQPIAAHARSNSVSRLHNNTSAMSAFGATDARKNDNLYACLQIRRAEFFCTKANLIKHSNYLMRVFEKQDYSRDIKQRTAQIKLRLPESTKADILIMFLDYIDRGKELPNKIDLYIAQNILLIAEALKMRQIQRKFLLEILIPMLNRENVIFFTKMAYNKLSAGKNDEQQLLQDDLESQTSHQNEEEFWFEFFSYALDLAASNVQYLIKMKSEELNKVLESSIVEEIIERAIKFYRADLQYDNTFLFDMLMKVRKCDSIFQLLEQERIKIIESEESLMGQMENGGVKPTLTWRIQNLTGNFYRESDPFMVENAQWKLSISYFKMEEEALSVQIKMVTNPFEVKKSKDYFKKKDFFLASNVAGGIQNQVNPLEEALDEDNLTQDEIARKRKQIEQANCEYPSHAFVTIVSSVRIDSQEKLSHPLVHTLICSAKSPALLKKFSDFKLEEYGGQVTVEIYFKIKYVYSAILLYISKNFSYLITDPHISLLPKDQLKLLLKHKLLNVTQEDEVVKALCMWSEGQELRSNLDSELLELLENVNWNFVSLQCILDLIRNFPYIRRNPSFLKTVNKEFAMRNKFNPETTNLDPPRFSYKYNKAHSNANMNKNSKNAKALLYVNHENFFQNLIDAMLEPVDIIKAHLVNEGINESSHRKHLELQLLQRKREIVQIEEQLNNMRIMEDIAKAASSRPPSRHKSGAPRPNSKQHQVDDDIETVKNSMINLLNVVVEADTGRSQQLPRQHIAELSQEAIAKMQHSSQMNRGEPNFDEMYHELSSIANNRKLKIMFKSSLEDEEEEKDGQFYGISNNARPIASDIKHDDGELIQTVEQNLPNDDQYDDDCEEAEEEESKFSKFQLMTSEAKTKQSQVVEVNEIRERSRSRQQLQVITSQSSRIIVGGGTLISANQPYQLNPASGPPVKVVDIESKGIQTSLQNMSKEEEQIVQLIDKVDQSIQMTFEEPSSYQDNSESQQEEQNIQEQFMPNEESSLCAMSDNVSQDSIKSLHSALDPGTKECTQQIDVPETLYSPLVVPEDDQTKQECYPQMQLSVDQQQHFEQLRVKYQKQLMQEYTQLVQKMSQDVFDQNFLKNFQLFSPASSMQENTLGGILDKATVGNSFQHTLSQPYNPLTTMQQAAPNQVQVRNPKVHNLNISIHNNSNYATPFPIDTIPNQNFTPLSRFTSPNTGNQQPQFNTTQQYQSIPLKSGVKSPTNGSQTKSTPTGSQQKMFKSGSGKKTQAAQAYHQHHPSQAFTPNEVVQQLPNQRQRPNTANQQYMYSARQQQQFAKGKAGFKKPQNFINLQIESAENTKRSQTPITSPEGFKQHNVSNTSRGVKGQFGMFGIAQQKGLSATQSQPLTQYVNPMPNSVKHSQPIKMYTYQNQQQATQKAVKSTAINKNQNKVILQHILSDSGNGSVSGAGQIVGQKTGTYQVSLDQSEGGHNMRTKTQPQGIYQWSTAQCTGPNDHQYSGAAHQSREKSNEHLQNEIMRLIVEEDGSFQAMHSQGAPKYQNWIQGPATGNIGGLTQSFNTKRSSIPPPQAPSTASYMANYNILDQLKSSTPQYQQQFQMRSQSNGSQNNSFLQSQHLMQTQGASFQMNTGDMSYYNVEMKPQTASFGSLATHQKQNQGNVVLDLAKLRSTAEYGQIRLHHLTRDNDLGTIEESKRSDRMQDSDSQNEQDHKVSHSQKLSSGTDHQLRASNGSGKQQSWHSRKQSLQYQKSNSNSLSHQSQGHQAQNRCQPHDMEEE